MDVEKLGMIVDLLSNLGDSTLEGVMYYFGYLMASQILSIAIHLLWALLIYKLSSFVIKAVKEQSIYHSALQEIRTVLKIGCAGMVNESELAAIKKRIYGLANNLDN